jgi:hypothetical protein
MEQSQGGVDGLAGDVIARHAFAPTFRLVLQDAAHQQIVGVRPAVRGVADRLSQGNTYVKRR